MRSSEPRVSILPKPTPSLVKAVESAGGLVVELSKETQGIIVDFAAAPSDLSTALESYPQISWVQLPSAGIEAFSSSISTHQDITWTSAKGVYAKPVAEHALALTLALLRQLPQRAKATSWGSPAGISLHGLNVMIIGAGGVALEILRLMKAFDTNVTMIRRQAIDVVGADRTFNLAELEHELPTTDVLIVAAALTPGTRSIIAAKELDLLPDTSIIVNIARGGLIDTSALTDALQNKTIAGAALDVTDPEPLPDGHPLWAHENALITPHSADTMEMIVPLLAERVHENVKNLCNDLQLVGLVDAEAGY